MSTSIVGHLATEWSNIQEFINEVATSVAIIERDWEGKIVVSACNPETELEESFSIADKLRIAIEQQDYIHTWRTDRAIPFTASIGVATRSPGETEVGAVLKRADQALYKAKEGGRNRVERA